MFSAVASLAGGFFAAVGLFGAIMVFVVPQKAPMDRSNRIAHFKLVWEALKSPHRFVGLKDSEGNEAFPYLTMDVGDYERGE